MIELYGRGQSRSFRALWALEESGLAYDYVAVEPGGNVPAHYRTINPQGKVPTLVDGDIVLTESAAIVNYVGARSGDATLVPGDPAPRARYDEISFFVMTDLEQPLWSIGKHRFALPEDVRLPGMLDTAKYEFAKSQRALHHHMDGARFAVGDAFTFADILLAHTINWALRFEMPVDKVFVDYRDRNYERPACQRALAIIETKA
ncbi:MAG: glutathione S-transferase family protein [Pseudomonadota bacterium]